MDFSTLSLPPLSKVFIITSIVVPIVIYFFVPRILSSISGEKIRSTALLFFACLLFFVSWYVPSPSIEGKYTAFATHFLGGGGFTALLWIYIRSQLHLRLHALHDICILYFLVSGLGVANEIFELIVVKVGLAHLDASDTWWDLLANTLGAFVIYGSQRAAAAFKK